MSCPAIFGDYALPTKLGSSFYHAQLNGVVTIVAPATNVNGIRLSTASALAVSGAVVVIFAATSAPSGYADTSKQVVYQIAELPGADINLVIPAGLGIYAATGMNIQFCLNYDIL